MLPRRLRKNPISVEAARTTFKGMLEHINNVKAGDVEKLSNPRNVSAAMRLSLATFLEEWTESDVGHEKYIENLIEGFDENEAIKMGDLLEWMAIGTDDQFSSEVRLPKGAKHTELVVLHAQLLDFLPMKSYNTFTMVQLLEDDPELVEEVFNNYVELTATEHDALQALTNIVKRGSIEAVRLLLESSPKHGEKGFGFTRTNNYGSLLIDTFELCRRATVAYKDGNYMGAKALLDQLYDEKGIDASLIRMDLSKMAVMALTKGGEGEKYGPGDIVLVSLIQSSLTASKVKGSKAIATQAAGDVNVDEPITDVKFDRILASGDLILMKSKDVKFKAKFSSKLDELNSARDDPEKLNLNQMRELIESKDEPVTFTIKLKDKNRTSDRFKQYTNFTIEKLIPFAEEEDDEEEEEEAEEETRRLRRNPVDKDTYENVMALVREKGMMMLGGGKKGKGGKKKEKILGCDVKAIMQGIYNNPQAGDDAVFIIHAYLKFGKGRKGEVSADMVPKGQVTFSTNKKGESGVTFHMYIEELPGATNVSRATLKPEEVDPMVKLTEAIAPETRRNPMPEPEFVSEHNTRTLAGQAAKARAIKTGENAYMWEEDGVYKVSIDFPGKIAPNTVTAYEAVTGRKLPEIPKNNPPLPIYAGVPKKVTENKGAIFAEIVIGRNIVKDVGEAVQSIYRGLIGGRTTMAEKRMAMAIAEMQVELSERAKDAGGNAVGNLKLDYEMVDNSATLTVMAHADALVIPKKNPQKRTRKEAEALAKKLGVFAVHPKYPRLSSIDPIEKINSRSDSYWLDNDWTVTRMGDMTEGQIAKLETMERVKWKDQFTPLPRTPKKNPKGAGKKGTSAVGNTYAIDLIPKSSVKLRSMKDIKKDNKILHKWRDSSAEMKALWKKYSATGKGGSGEVFIASRTFKTAKYQMKKGQRWNPIKPPYTTAGRAKVKEQAANKNLRMGDVANRDMKRFIRSGTLIPDPSVQRVGEVGDSFVKYKKGKVRMELLLARHKESGSLVPFRLYVPAALFRHDKDTLIPRSGSGDTKGAKQLLSLIEQSFGEIKFHKNMGKGGLNLTPGKATGAIDEGVAKVFKTGGLKTPDGKVARPFLFDANRLTYQAGGRQYVMEVSR